jgi:hypothetical protein
MIEKTATREVPSLAPAVAKTPTREAATAEPPSKVYPYEPPRALAPNLWQVKGSLPMPGVPRNMTAYRLADGRLVLYSVIAMHEDGMGALEALGRPAIMVMPHERHQMDAPFYKRRYPQLRVLAPEPTKTRTVPIDGGLEELEALGSPGIRAYALPGTSYHEAILELPVEGRIALCTCELLGNLRGTHGLMRLAMKWLGPSGGDFGVSRAVRWREVVDRPAVRAWLETLAGRDDIRMVLLGHGEPVLENVRAALRGAAAHA